MTLHKTIELARKFLLGVGAGIGVVVVIFIIFQLGIIIKNILFPPQVQPPTVIYGKLPEIPFPPSVMQQNLTFSLNTITGTFPQLPNRLSVFPIAKAQPNFLNLAKAREKAGQFRFVNPDGTLLPETKIDDATYQWSESGGLARKLTLDIITFNFNLESNYLSSSELPTLRNFSESNALNKVTSLLQNLTLTPTDLDTTKIESKNTYTTKPQLFARSNGQLVPVTLLSETQVIRVDLYQKDVMYKLNTGIPEVTGAIKKEDVAFPVLYPRPPYSTMTFWLASNGIETDVVASNFFYQKPLVDDTTDATYPLKTAEQAFEELQNGKGYIASYHGTETDIRINNVFLAYYLGDTAQQYLMPIIVFEGNNGFFAYVSAIQNEWVE